MEHGENNSKLSSFFYMVHAYQYVSLSILCPNLQVETATEKADDSAVDVRAAVTLRSRLSHIADPVLLNYSSAAVKPDTPLDSHCSNPLWLPSDAEPLVCHAAGQPGCLSQYISSLSFFSFCFFYSLVN